MHYRPEKNSAIRTITPEQSRYRNHSFDYSTIGKLELIPFDKIDVIDADTFVRDYTLRTDRFDQHLYEWKINRKEDVRKCVR